MKMPKIDVKRVFLSDKERGAARKSERLFGAASRRPVLTFPFALFFSFEVRYHWMVLEVANTCLIVGP